MSTVPDSTPHVNLDPGFYGAVLGQRLSAHVADLRASLRTIEEGSYHAKAATSRPGAFLRFGIGEGAGIDGAQTRLCRRCFVSLVGELVTYLDRMIAGRRLLGTKVTLPPNTTLNEAQAFVQARIEEEYQQVAKDTRLTNPKKIAEFAGINNFARDAAHSYFDIRRVIEHRGGVTEKPITLRYMRPKMMAGQIEITASGQPAAPGTGLSIGIDHVSRTLDAGLEVVIMEEEIEHVMFTIQALIAPEIERVWRGTPTPT
jgi:hypothetical protein